MNESGSYTLNFCLVAQHGGNTGNKSLQNEVKNFLLLTSLAIVNEPGHVKRWGDPPGQKSTCETTRKQADGESLQRPRGHTSPGRPEQSSAKLLVFVPDGTAVTMTPKTLSQDSCRLAYFSFRPDCMRLWGYETKGWIYPYSFVHFPHVRMCNKRE